MQTQRDGTQNANDVDNCVGDASCFENLFSVDKDENGDIPQDFSGTTGEQAKTIQSTGGYDVKADIKAGSLITPKNGEGTSTSNVAGGVNTNNARVTKFLNLRTFNAATPEEREAMGADYAKSS
eukprot:Awhi_evm1s5311